MSWITVFWSINLGACLTLAAFYCAVWCKQRQTWAHLLFSCSAIAAAAISAFELGMMNAQTVEQYQTLVRWIHLPTWVLTVSFVAFVRVYLQTGRPWLAWGWHPWGGRFLDEVHDCRCGRCVPARGRATRFVRRGSG